MIGVAISIGAGFLTLAIGAWVADRFPRFFDRVSAVVFGEDSGDYLP